MSISLSTAKDSFTAQLRPYIRRHKAVFCELFTCGILVNFFSLTLPIFSSYIYDKVLGNGISTTMWALAIAMGLIIAVEWSVRVIRVILAEQFARDSESAIDDHVMRGLLATKTNHLPPIGGVIEKYKQLLNYRDFLSSNYVLALTDVPFLALFLFAILLAAGPLVLVPLTFGCLLLVSQIVFTPIALEYEGKSRHSGEKRLEQMADILSSREAIIGGDMQRAMTRNWDANSGDAIEASSKARLWRGVTQSLGGSLGFLCYVSVLVGGVFMVENHSLTSGGLLAASMLSSRVIGGFASIATLVVRYHEFKRAVVEMSTILPESETAETSQDRGKLLGELTFQHITCRMQDRQLPVLKDVSFRINPGELVGIAGAPGAGKTTLLRLMCGLIAPDEGEVLIDQVPLRLLSPRDLATNLGYKPQEPSLMEGTIEENICAGRTEMTADQRAHLLVSTGLSASFQQQGLHWATAVGPRGGRLSGGQRQMVALARALLDTPSILLLDEPTIGLDAALEQHITDQIMKRKGTTTIVVSTHSRSLLSICDRIIVVGDGRLLANGPREKILMAS